MGSKLRVAVVGCGTAGPATALLLARDGHDVEVFERVARPRGVGAGILLQALGQRVLAELGLADALERRSSPVHRVDARNSAGRKVMDFAYADAVPGSYGWGVSRVDLFELLWDSLVDHAIPVRAGLEIVGLSAAGPGWELRTAAGERVGPFDLVVGADGARSRIRRLSGLAVKDVGYPYGALWSVVSDPAHLAGDCLFQGYEDTRTTLGVLPTGTAQASIFWSVRSRDITTALRVGASAWVARAIRHARHLAPLLESARQGVTLGARYRDVVVRSPILLGGGRGGGLVLVGDAAHAMSPQLGLGASLALADAWSLAASLRSRPGDMGGALRAHEADRRGHVRYYTWCSRLMTPVFQSDLIPMAWGRDLLLEPAARIPWVRRQFVTTLMGTRTSPWTQWRPEEL